eukprot:CAMPEP_0206621234 /NCGR_PEP_ID=MMETSP0325_2-20121206/62101_1 /ASSEMBLY_ACC=CAM_ASM_000347 /TAXON_ID=2866 /ORGANISM="Crypthecodinium cohnii, Strain Seligo" /LENGTH=84 /DNA_ID=CAMNT_0054144353 /DNA_START=143 /DNA_END=393 /DNA_ORIENTATION=-
MPGGPVETAPAAEKGGAPEVEAEAAAGSPGSTSPTSPQESHEVGPIEGLAPVPKLSSPTEWPWKPAATSSAASASATASASASA